MNRLVPILFGIYLILLAMYLGFSGILSFLSPLLALFSLLIVLVFAFPWGERSQESEEERARRKNAGGRSTRRTPAISGRRAANQRGKPDGGCRPVSCCVKNP